MIKLKNKVIIFAVLVMVGILVLSNIFVLSAASTEIYINEGYTVSGYISPDFSIDSSVASLILTGTKVEISGTSLSATCDGSGYFELKNIPDNSSGYTLKISKSMYLTREIRNVPVYRDIIISTQNAPIYIWAGDVNSDGAINMSDIMPLAGAFNSTKGDLRFNDGYDFNKDNVINMSDIMIFPQHFNKTTVHYPELKIEYPTLPPTVPATLTPTKLPTQTPTMVPTPTQTSSSVMPSVAKNEDIRMTYSGLTTVSYGGYLNGESFQQDGITSYNGYEYSAFWNTNKHVVMCRRKLPSGDWAKFEFTDYTLSAEDAHNTVSIGICPADGTMHLAFDHHGNDLHYRVSAAGLMTNPANYTWAASNFGSVSSNLVGSIKITLVTYPRFITEPSNKMLFEYRYGTSGSGDQYLLEYDGTTHQWTSLGKYIDGITFDNNAYANGITYDKNGRLHETWCWRETPDATTNHDLLYIYSDDNGRTWKNNAGTTVSVTGKSYIDKNTSGIKVWTINQNRGLLNQEAQAVDNNGQIHVMMSHMRDSQADDSNFTNARTKSVYFHYWRDSSGTWHRTEMGFSVIGNFRGKLAFSSSINIYAVLPNIRIAAASAASNWSDWTLINIQDAGRFFSDPLIDDARLKEQANTLTVFCPVPNSPDIYNLTYLLK